MWAAAQRDKYKELLDDTAVEYYFEVEEVSND